MSQKYSAAKFSLPSVPLFEFDIDLLRRRGVAIFFRLIFGLPSKFGNGDQIRWLRYNYEISLYCVKCRKHRNDYVFKSYGKIFRLQRVNVTDELCLTWFYGLNAVHTQWRWSTETWRRFWPESASAAKPIHLRRHLQTICRLHPSRKPSASLQRSTKTITSRRSNMRSVVKVKQYFH